MAVVVVNAPPIIGGIDRLPSTPMLFTILESRLQIVHRHEAPPGTISNQDVASKQPETDQPTLDDLFRGFPRWPQ